jgi:hypothetical protein
MKRRAVRQEAQFGVWRVEPGLFRRLFHKTARYCSGDEIRPPPHRRLAKPGAWRRILWAIALFAALLLATLIFFAANGTPHVTKARCPGSPFITALGPTLCAYGYPLRLIGYNWRWIGTGCPAPADEQIELTFSQIRTASKANVVRTAFYQSGSGGGTYTTFDRYVDAAKRHGLYIVPILANEWTNCEPSNAAKTIAWYRSGYKLSGDGYPRSYRDYVRSLVAHYASEPTIAFWQLVNEPDAPGSGCGAGAAQALRTFADDLVSVIKSVDRHHLVDLGVPGICAGDNPTDYQTIVEGSLEVADVWHDYQRVTAPAPSLLRQRVQVLRRLQKPAVVGESGICADVGTRDACTGSVSHESLARRATLFDAKLAAGFALGLSGYMIWNRGSHSIQDDVGPGDPTEGVLRKYALTTPGSTLIFGRLGAHGHGIGPRLGSCQCPS